MISLYRKVCLPLLLLGGLLGWTVCSPAAHAQTQLMANGNFEAGNFNSWIVANQAGSGGNFFLGIPGAATPAVNGFSFATAGNALGDNYYAVTNSDSPGAHVLYQDFTVTPGFASVSLSFQMFVNDQSGFGGVVNPSGLDYTTGGTYDLNQHARVDLLKSSVADAFSTDPADLLTTFYLGADGAAFDIDGNLIPNPYTDYFFDISSFVGGGGNYRLRFGEVDNNAPVNLGLDNVSILAAPSVVPESEAWMLLLGGALPLLVFRRRRRA